MFFVSYELFRSSIVSRISEMNLPPKQLNDIIAEIDRISSQYDITRRSTDLIVSSDFPEVAKMFLASLAVENKSKSTINDYKQKLFRFFSSVRKPYNTITANDVRLYLWQYQQDAGLQKSSLDHVRIVLNTFFNWLLDQELLQRNPCRLIDPIRYQTNKLPPMDTVELEYLRAACESPREKALVDFLVSTGCRISECAAVRLADIDWDDRSVIIRHGKGDKERTTYFNAESRVSLQAYLDSKKSPSEYLFSRSRAPYGKVTSKALQDIIKTICSRVSDRLGVHVTAHTFRRTMATQLIDSGMPIEEVRELLGHAKLDTTMRYVTLSKKRIKASYDKHFS